jgi:hypothetical protein
LGLGDRITYLMMISRVFLIGSVAAGDIEGFSDRLPHLTVILRALVID